MKQGYDLFTVRAAGMCPRGIVFCNDDPKTKLMNTIGRNDPCPCGSGKKYKKCHGAAAILSPDSAYNRIRRFDAESGEMLMRYAKKHYGEAALEDAWQQFHFFDEALFIGSPADNDSFLRWFAFNWRPDEKETLAEKFIADEGLRLDGGLRRFLEATLQSPYSFFQTIAVDPGTSIEFRDVLRRREFHVTERTASTMVRRGDILLARAVELDGVCFLMGSGALIIPPLQLDHVLDLRAFLEALEPTGGEHVSTQNLLKQEELLREAYFEIEDELRNRRMDIRNTDGDHLAFHTLTYEIPSFDEAFQNLKELEQRVSGRTDEELLADAKRTRTGKPTEVMIHWLRRSRKGKLDGNTALATLKISASKLIVEVNSERRSKRIQKEIAKRLGGSAVLLGTEMKSYEGLMIEAEKGGKRKRSAKESESDRAVNESPEVRALLKELMDKHWATWPDTSVPALRGMTPREAAKDPLGRELLEALLMDFETRNELRDDESMRVDLAKLRRELGLETK